MAAYWHNKSQLSKQQWLNKLKIFFSFCMQNIYIQYVLFEIQISYIGSLSNSVLWQRCHSFERVGLYKIKVDIYNGW